MIYIFVEHLSINKSLVTCSLWNDCICKSKGSMRAMSSDFNYAAVSRVRKCDKDHLLNIIVNKRKTPIQLMLLSYSAYFIDHEK